MELISLSTIDITPVGDKNQVLRVETQFNETTSTPTISFNVIDTEHPETTIVKILNNITLVDTARYTGSLDISDLKKTRIIPKVNNLKGKKSNKKEIARIKKSNQETSSKDYKIVGINITVDGDTSHIQTDVPLDTQTTDTQDNFAPQNPQGASIVLQPSNPTNPDYALIYLSGLYTASYAKMNKIVMKEGLSWAGFAKPEMITVADLNKLYDKDDQGKYTDAIQKNGTVFIMSEEITQKDNSKKLVPILPIQLKLFRCNYAKVWTEDFNLTDNTPIQTETESTGVKHTWVKRTPDIIYKTKTLDYRKTSAFLNGAAIDDSYSITNINLPTIKQYSIGNSNKNLDEPASTPIITEGTRVEIFAN